MKFGTRAWKHLCSNRDVHHRLQMVNFGHQHPCNGNPRHELFLCLSNIVIYSNMTLSSRCYMFVSDLGVVASGRRLHGPAGRRPPFSRLNGVNRPPPTPPHSLALVPITSLSRQARERQSFVQ